MYYRGPQQYSTETMKLERVTREVLNCKHSTLYAKSSNVTNYYKK